MKQLVLDIRLDAPPRLDNYFVGNNRPLLAALGELVRGDAPTHLYLWGAPASGRSHLLRAVCAEADDARYLGAADVADPLPAVRVLAIDDVGQLDEAGQTLLFNAFNRARESGQRLLVAGDASPRGLALREDLRTRIGQCLAFEIQPLTDASRSAILSALATQRGLRLDGDVINYVMRHGRRDMPALLHTLDALDRAALERKRAITLPLLRELMRAGLTI